MFPSQTAQVLIGLLVALLYAGAVLAIGVLFLMVTMGKQARTNVRARIGLFGFQWLGFVVGQGILGVAWLILSLAGILHAWFIGIVCALAWFLGCVIVLAFRRQAARAVRPMWASFLSFRRSQSWYFWVGMGIVIVGMLRGVIALLPTEVADALWVYLAHARVIADSHTLKLQPFVHPNFALLPLQVEMHWAALFALANETAVTVWDYLCALSFLSGIGFLAWSLTSSRRVVLLAVLMMLSTPGFYLMMGGGKTDNAAAQYGMAAFLWLVLWPILGHRSVILAGLCVGWAMAGRYTNVIILPALIVFAVVVVQRTWKAWPVDAAGKHLKGSWVTNALLGCVSAGLAGAPMLMKNWLLVGCPLAPQFGCQGTFWANIYRIAHAHRQNISSVDLLSYPFVWTFAHREDMLGNISPLYIGFLPFLLAYHRVSTVQSALIAGLAGLVSMSMWWLVKPLILYTRWLLIPLGLLAVPLSASVVAAEQDLRHSHIAHWLVRGAILIILVFLLFQSRAIVYSIRYVTSIDSRTARYESMPGYEVSAWLNAHMQPGQRVALYTSWIYPYFMDPTHLLNSESAEELQWLWEHYGSLSPSSWTADFWHFYARNGFTYVIVAKELVDEAVAAWPDNLARGQPQVVFVGRNAVILRIEKV